HPERDASPRSTREGRGLPVRSARTVQAHVAHRGASRHREAQPDPSSGAAAGPYAGGGTPLCLRARHAPPDRVRPSGVARAPARVRPSGFGRSAPLRGPVAGGSGGADRAVAPVAVEAETIELCRLKTMQPIVTIRS